MITVVFWKWRPFDGYRSHFKAEHVNVAARMVRRHYKGALEIVLITDDADGVAVRGPGSAEGVDRILPLWDDFRGLWSPHDRPGAPRRNPACYPRLKMFEAAAASWLGERVISIDLDCVITGDLAPIFERREDIVLWGDTNPTTYYNGGLILHTPGKRAFLWEEFKANPSESIAFAQRLRQWGSDQGWISARLGPNEARFRASHGVYSYRQDIRKRRGESLPEDARIVFFHGEYDPWGAHAQRLPWVREHWR